LIWISEGGKLWSNDDVEMKLGTFNQVMTGSPDYIQVMHGALWAYDGAKKIGPPKSIYIFYPDGTRRYVQGTDALRTFTETNGWYWPF
jgi:hypothetical protein